MTTNTIGILDYGAGNFGSVRRALEALSVTPVAVSEAKQLDELSHLIFPGVGSAQQAMNELRSRGLDHALVQYARSGRPLLGICVGMQVLGRWSAEGQTDCLALLPYNVQKFECAAPIPHMGWNSLEWNTPHSVYQQASEGLAKDSNFYFVHSYAAFTSETRDEQNCVLAACNYGGMQFAAFVAEKNVWGAQCHIEKSGRAGLTFLRNFLNTVRT